MTVAKLMELLLSFKDPAASVAVEVRDSRLESGNGGHVELWIGGGQHYPKDESAGILGGGVTLFAEGDCYEVMPPADDGAAKPVLELELAELRKRIEETTAEGEHWRVSPLEGRIQEALRKANRQVEYANLAGLGFDRDEGGPHPYDVIEADLLAGLLEVRQLRGHVHEWVTSDDRTVCGVCGADGDA